MVLIITIFLSIFSITLTVMRVMILIIITVSTQSSLNCFFPGPGAIAKQP